MTRPCRRSSRLQQNSTPGQFEPESSTANLASLIERDESPPDGSGLNIDTIMSTASCKPAKNLDSPVSIASMTKTPETHSRFRPNVEEMHPSKAHRSTSKHIGSVVRPGSTRENGPIENSGPVSEDAQSTPTKLPGSWPAQMTSPNFNFSIAQNESILSAEAQRIMESVRGEAAKIKVQMQVERAKQDYMDGEVDRPYGVGGRAIAKPKGKAGRYSDAHMQEFKKMDSIAGHASVWKTKMQATPIQRSKSKGDLEADEPAKQLPRSKSFKLIRSNDTERLENTAPGKRAKKTHDDDTSTARPLSQGKLSENENFGLAHPKALPQSGLPLAVLTPTKSSLTRTASAKSMKTSMIPSLGRSNSTKTLGSPAVSRTEGSSKYIASLAKFSNMKSILHRHQPKLFNDPVKVDARPHQPVEGGAKLDKELPSLPGTPSLGLKRSPTLTKRVDFTPNSKPRPHLTPVSPSPSRIPASPTQRQVVYPSVSQPIVYPLLANSPNITTRSKTPRMSTPGDFTFRADKTIQFNPISPSKATSTIRQVRPSGITTPLSVFENPPPIPHGLINKKRRRVESDDEDVENSASQNPFSTNDDEPRAKKLKSLPPKEMQTEKALKSTANGSRVPKSGKKEKGKGVLTLSRLNMLARPKKR